MTDQFDATDLRRHLITVRVLPERSIADWMMQNLGAFTAATVKLHLHSRFANRELVALSHYMKALQEVLWSHCTTLPPTQIDETLYALSDALSDNTTDTLVEIN
jgi:hypothetical protein